MAEQGSQPGDGLSPNGGHPNRDGSREDAARLPLPGSSHLVPSVSGAQPGAAGANGAHADGANGANGANGTAGGVLSVDDPRTRALLEQLLQTIGTDSGPGAGREKPHTSLIAEGWMALRRRWKPMLVMFALTLAAVSWKLRPTGSQFVATATMQLPKSASGGGPDISILGAQRDAPGSALDTQIAILESRTFTEVTKYVGRGIINGRASGGLLTARVGNDAVKVPAEAALKAIDGATFKAQAPLSPELVDVTVTSDNPATSITLANASIDLYGQRLTQKGMGSQEKDIDFVYGQREIALKKLNKAKQDLQSYKEKVKVIDIQEALARNNANVENLTQAERATRIEADAGAQASSVSGDVSSQNLQQSASQLRLNYDAVLRDYFPSSPEAREAEAKWSAAQKLYTDRVARLVKQNAEAARVAAKTLAEARARADTLPGIENRLSQLQDIESQNAKTYSDLAARYTQLALTGKAQPATSDPIQRAISTTEVSRTWVRTLLTALLCSLVVAGLAAFVVEQLDHSLHSVSDLEPLLPVGVLGTMPLLRGRSERRLAQMTGAQPMAPRVLEACRIVRSNLSFATMDSPAQAILITSAAPGEGKSLSALNLATVTAFDGRRVLLLDCDLRRPSQHTLNGLPLEPGFTNLQSGEASLEDAIQSTRVNNLWVMTAGTLPLNPPELLGSPETRSLLQDLKSRFDVIVIDSPPVLALTDAQVLCSQADGVVMIVAAESTSKQEVQRAQGMLRHAGGRLLGAVFNKVRRADTAAGYGTYTSYGPNMLGRDRALSESVGTLGRR